MPSSYLYQPSKFPEPQVRVDHITLTAEFSGDTVTVSADTLFTVTAEKIRSLRLNAKNLQIETIQQNTRNVSYTYADDIIDIRLHHSCSAGTQFRIFTKTACRPTDNILEGFYYDFAPEGSPRTIITQCQQWGFQRIAPCLDDMRAKCTWTTTIIADRRYTNLISNGNVLRPRTRFDEQRDTITYQNDEPMPPYLFFMGVGTWDTFARSFIYPDGRTVRLELLALPGADRNNAFTAVDIMADAILWTHIFTGPERYDSLAERRELYRLCTIRYNLAKGKTGEELSAVIAPVTADIQQTAKDMVMGYQYPYEVYREIAMQNSDFGGMENTGNTTIIASRIMPDAEITDASYEYMLGVKQHEFYHNLNGSGVTGDTPFSIWLNEAVTVMMEDDYLAFHFGKEYVRLQNLLQMYTPGTGTFSLDTGAVAMPIEPDGFNDPNDLITSVTYVKAPEFTRMIETILGKPAFAWALDLYHKRFAGRNASPRDWLHAMEDIGKTDFSFMADRWLKQTGYPTVTASAVYDADAGTANITVRQKGFVNMKPWIFPFAGKLLNTDGEVVAEFMKRIDAETLSFAVPCRGEFTFGIWNLNHAAYLKMETDVSDDILYMQALYDTNPVTQFLSHCALLEREMIRLMKDEAAVPSPRFAEEYMRMLSDAKLMESCGGIPLTMFESVNDPAFAYSYTKLYSARKRILKGIAGSYRDVLMRLLPAYSIDTPAGAFAPAELARRFKAHEVKNQILAILASEDSEEVRQILKRSYELASCSTNRLAAFSLYLSSSAPDRMDMLKAELERCKDSPLAFENAVAAAAGSSSPDTVLYLKQIEASPSFHVEQAGCARALYIRFAQNRKLSLETEEGRAFLEGALVKLATVNAYITTGMLSVFSHMQEYSPEVRGAAVNILRKVESSVPAEKSPAVIQLVKQLLAAGE